MKLKINYLAIAAAGIYLCLDRSGIAIWILIAACVHESGHFLAAILLKQKIKELNISIFSASMIKEQGSVKAEILVSSAGPFLGLVFAGLMILFGNQTAAAASVVLTVFNLLPMVPLDGWRIVHLILARKFSPERTEKISFILSIISWIGFISFIIFCFYQGFIAFG